MITAEVRRTSSGQLGKAMKALALARRREVAVGFPASKASGSVIERAIHNNFGTSRIPPRPFMQLAMNGNRSKYRSAMRKMGVSVFNGKYDIATGLARLGILASGDIQSEITSLRNPANAASTIARKKSSNPLLDSGEMRQSVTYHVRPK